MAADFTARRVLSRANFWLLLLITSLTSCTRPEDRIDQVVMNSEEGDFSQLNGVVLLDKEPFTGTMFTLFPDSRDTARIVRYLVGREHGVWKQFYLGGRLLDRREFRRGQKVGELISWYENGRKKLHYYFENDEYEGTCREWNEQGQLVQEMNYHAGHEEGPQRMFYDNGKIRSNYVVKDGRRYGLLGTKNCVNVSDSVFVE